ncbi:MAG: recombination protein O N-terminal domain-containing protein [Deltaproteobacteria bacterium]|jgi:DNA repair protein RecO|nr:recombination protein O N-terminal domain-containing protein [Deltaproteobacteria bacterium]
MFESSPAIIINKFALKEADLILTLLSRDLGKLKAVSYGARVASRRSAGSPDLLECAVFELSPPRPSSELYVIRNISKKIIWHTLREDITRFTLSTFCLEICNLFSFEGEVETAKFFNPLYHTLNNINKKEVNETQCFCVVIYFTLMILNLAGYNPTEYKNQLVNVKELDIKIWFSKMLDFNSPILFDNLELIKNGFSFLVEFLEIVLNRRLKTAQELFNILN